ncbi:MAG: tRNA pseudouridine(55) synthase TruB [Bacteroidales bacterium]
MQADWIEGAIILIDKPEGWTSFDVVKRVRNSLSRHLGVKRLKVGHAGTLDPLATGLLILCTGKWTKMIDKIQQAEKTYTGTIRFGATTPSYDRETEPDATFDYAHITPDMLDRLTKKFTGRIRQVPPAFSAVMVNGVRAYKLARKDEEVELKSREVEIYNFRLTRVEMPEVDFEVTCSKGTYIRSLAHDFGKAAGSGAFLQSLRRTRIGDYSVDDALSPEDFVRQLTL